MTTIITKNSSTAGAVPTASDLVQGELAVNVTDRRIYTENASGTVVELGTNPSVPITFPDGSASAPSLTNDGDTNTGVFFPAADTVGITTGGTERVRVDSAGNVGVGVTPSAWGSSWKSLDMAYATTLATNDSGTAAFGSNWRNDGTNYIYKSGGYAGMYLSSSATSSVHRWYTAPSGTAGNSISFTQAMTLDSSGNLLVGTTSVLSGTTGTNLVSSNTNGILAVHNTNASFGSTLFYGLTSRAANAGFDFHGDYANGVGQFRVSGAGVIYAQNTSVQSISDQRLKENIRDAADGLAVINALRPVRFDWKEGFGNDRKDQLGFIAQEVEAVFPEAVSEWQVNKEDETIYKTVGPSALIPVLVKAIQEQQAIIQTLTSRIEALEQA